MRPIDAEALAKRLKHSPLFLGTNLQFKDGVIDLVERQPTLDVVPREEEEKWFIECEELQGRFIEIEKETAREIFEVIYEDCFDQFGYIDYEKLAEFKKKYTED